MKTWEKENERDGDGGGGMVGSVLNAGKGAKKP